MKNRIVIAPVLCLMGSILLLFLIGSIMLWLTSTPEGRWHLVSRPPIPPDALHLQEFYPSNDVERIFQFQVAQPATTIQQFYRRALSQNGWRYRCTSKLLSDTTTTIMDLYDGRATLLASEQTLEVKIQKSGAKNPQGEEAVADNRLVQVNQWLTKLPSNFCDK